RSRPVGVRGEVQKRRTIQKRRIAHSRIVEGDPFWSSTRRTDPPDIHLTGRIALHEVDERLVWRPGLEMGMLWNRSGVERLGFGALGLHEHRVAGRRRVIGEAPSIGRPTDFGNAFEGDLWFAAKRWHDPGADRAIVAVGCSHPEKETGAVRRELNRSSLS